MTWLRRPAQSTTLTARLIPAGFTEESAYVLHPHPIPSPSRILTRPFKIRNSRLQDIPNARLRPPLSPFYQLIPYNIDSSMPCFPPRPLSCANSSIRRPPSAFSSRSSLQVAVVHQILDPHPIPLAHQRFARKERQIKSISKLGFDAVPEGNRVSSVRLEARYRANAFASSRADCSRVGVSKIALGRCTSSTGTMHVSAFAKRMQHSTNIPNAAFKRV
ncbi:hypothetical protein R3P38DRAFT_3084116 [Favolaschia claudopus]|uniref:Ribosomal protein S14 n=1 Tax=Favolaschia claudopus TaxID=2862362 RepID=A0AAV9ZUE0_9AGAR